MISRAVTSKGTPLSIAAMVMVSDFVRLSLLVVKRRAIVRAEYDVIDLSTIDADTTWSGNLSFTYVGSNAFSGEAGELNFRSGIISGDVNGDGYADFQIRVNGVTSLRVDDFFL